MSESTSGNKPRHYPLLVFVGLLAVSSGCGPSAAPSPSILLITIDTLRADAVSAYGDVEATTPTFDTLAAAGHLYTRAYAPSPWTLPSHASLFTGMTIDGHGVGLQGRVTLPQAAQTLAERLRDAGYETAGFSENALISQTFGFDQGFDHFAVHTVAEQFASRKKLVIDVVDEVARWLGKRDSQRPFFAFINLYDPHEPYKIRSENPFLPESATTADANRIKAGGRTSHLICDRLPSEGQLEILQGLYLGEVAAADRKLKDILDVIEAHSVSDLITVVTSDHGEHFGEHRLLDHEFSVREEVLRVPLLVHRHDMEAATIGRPVEIRDITRSLLRWGGADATGISAEGLERATEDAGQSPESLFALYSDTRMRFPSSLDADTAQRVQDFKRQGCKEGDRVFGDMVAVTRYPFRLTWYENYPSEFRDLRGSTALAGHGETQPTELLATLEREARQFAIRTGLGTHNNQEPVSPESERALKSLGYID